MFIKRLYFPNTQGYSTMYTTTLVAFPDSHQTGYLEAHPSFPREQDFWEPSILPRGTRTLGAHHPSQENKTFASPPSFPREQDFWEPSIHPRGTRTLGAHHYSQWNTAIGTQWIAILSLSDSFVECKQ